MHLRDMRINVKILLAIAVIAVVAILSALYGGSQISAVNETYKELLRADEAAKLANARGARRLATYGRDIYSLVLETTDEGNARGKAQIESDEKDFLTKKDELAALLPGRKDDVTSAYAPALAAIDSCRPVAKAAAEAASAEDIMKVGARMKTECEPKLLAAQTSLTSFTDTLIANAARIEAQTSDSARHTSTVMLTGSILGLIAGIALTLWIVRSGVTAPLSTLGNTMEGLAGGRLDLDVPGADRKDEIGEMARTVQVFKDNAIRVKAMEQEQQTAKARAEQERKRAMLDMADSFESAVMGLVKGVSAQASEMQATSQSMSSSAHQSQVQASSVAAAAEQATANVQTVASAAEELSSSISEISRQVAEAATISQSASDATQRTNEMVQGLAKAADKIGEVVSLITDIASQTNLLALNATIEAARAGEAGKGFAVVANEVKNLANQTGRATDEISAQIGAVQEETKRVVEAIGSIGKVIDQVQQISSGIASAVEEQGAATQEIARNVQQAAEGTQSVSSNIMGITEAASSTGAAAQQVLSAAGDLAKNSETLRGEVDRFLGGVRSA